MSSQSEYAGSAGTKNFHTGSTSWSSTGNATGAPDSVYASNTPGHNQVTDSLDFYNFGFSIPGGATINGVSATVTALKSTSNNATWTTPAFSIECASTVGAFTANVVSNGTALTTSAAGYITGSSTDLAGLASQLTVSNINSNVENTGITLGATFGSTNITGNTVEVDACQCTVFYTASSTPGAPTGLTVTSDVTNPTTALDLSWTAGTGSPTSYDIQRSSTLGGTFSTLATGVTGTTYTDSSLTPGSEYAYQVAGVNGSGVGSYCSPVAWATEAAAPSSIAVSSSTTTSITLTLTAPTLGSNIGVDQYDYRYETPVGAANWVNGSWIGGPFTISSLTPGTQYGIEIATSIDSTNGDWSTPGGIVGRWSSELTTVTPINAIPARCWIVAARKIDGWSVHTF
ncbi:MAG TPA: fibronectin type III domain-containing protein [Planctomycetaceae bacterium]|jgi:hypothetical protein|nr:fibronectin type III domain-containing protein [Planctomycetaceae bacterium]